MGLRVDVVCGALRGRVWVGVPQAFACELPPLLLSGSLVGWLLLWVADHFCTARAAASSFMRMRAEGVACVQGVVRRRLNSAWYTSFLHWGGTSRLLYRAIRALSSCVRSLLFGGLTSPSVAVCGNFTDA